MVEKPLFEGSFYTLSFKAKNSVEMRACSENHNGVEILAEYLEQELRN